MFTGLVEEIGIIRAATRQQGGVRFVISAERVLAGLEIGDSVAVSGVCLTVVEKAADRFEVDAVQETLQRSTLARWTEGTAVNLERALAVGGRWEAISCRGMWTASAGCRICRCGRRATG